jgi:hypothetical protein
MSYLPDNERRCIAMSCRLAKTCARHNCPPGGPHWVGDLSIDMVASSCPHYAPLNFWQRPVKAAPQPRTHECPEGLL